MELQEKKTMIIMMFIFFFIGGIVRNIYLTYSWEWLRGIPQIMLALTFFIPLVFFIKRKIRRPVTMTLSQLFIVLIDLSIVVGLLFLGISSYFQPFYKP